MILIPLIVLLFVFNDYVLETLLDVTFSGMVTIFNIILWPFNQIIEAFMPDFTNAVNQLTVVFDYAGTYLGWILNAAAIPSTVLSLVVAYWVFVLSTKVAVWIPKTVLKWWGHFS